MDLDRYGREVSRCEVGGEDLGARLVASGAALAYTLYSRDYVAEERAAEAAGEGLWRGSFERPWDWRRAEREARREPDASLRGTADAVPEADPGTAPEGCAVKGNVSSRGRIYHLPGGRDYARTRIDEEAGERWFCSEAEAREAGWRAPLS